MARQSRKLTEERQEGSVLMAALTLCVSHMSAHGVDLSPRGWDMLHAAEIIALRKLEARRCRK